MKTLKVSTFVVICVGLIGILIAAIQGCESPQQASVCAYRAPGSRPKAHGGTANVNDAAFDAMFFKNYGVNPFIDTDDDNLSTFALDVDTGSYTLARSYLNRGHLPEADGVRVEEFVNYFKYGYEPPSDGQDFAIHMAAAPSRFSADRTLFRVGLKAREINAGDRKDAILTFVIDVSG